MKILLAKPRGFCAGVDRAIHIVEKALEKFGRPIYVRHEIVHNKTVVDRLRQMGAVFVEDLAEVPEGAVVVFSAHGVAENVYAQAAQRKQHVLDASCPLVKKVHLAAKRQHDAGAHVVLIGHAGHAEVEGTLGQLPPGAISLVGSVDDLEQLNVPEQASLAFITQTTLSVDETRDVIAALKRRFPGIKGPDRGDLCYATTNRQAAVRAICNQIDILLVVGASNSSNSNRLRELGSASGVPSYLIADAQDIHMEWFHHVERVGLTSGASAPEEVVKRVVAWIQSAYPGSSVETHVGMEEHIRFSLPTELVD
ncbi:MAG TPA: 4-hydroxy-3-methylbut-2-enyl diphosphate reductase [Fibrobacteraceae bacterium]|nr:4-hydroxy-3-methylbut-2-enyl diphosphate reductase [Fibrobacteraceae bacterium]